jgi:hypothetical protein
MNLKSEVLKNGATMKQRALLYRTSLSLVLLVALRFSLPVSAQVSSSVPVTGTSVERPNPTGPDPMHEDAKRAILQGI